MSDDYYNERSDQPLHTEKIVTERKIYFLDLKENARGKFVKITEDVRKYAAEQAISEEEALQRGMKEKSKEFVEAGAEVYATA